MISFSGCSRLVSRRTWRSIWRQVAVTAAGGTCGIRGHGGVLVNVPKPERYAVHKLIVAQRRTATAAKRPKDLLPHRLSSSPWRNAVQPSSPPLGRKHTTAAQNGESCSKTVCHNSIQQAAISCSTPSGKHVPLSPRWILNSAIRSTRYDFSRDVVVFAGVIGNQQKDCAISREALDDWFDAEGKGKRVICKRFAGTALRFG